MVRTRGLMAVFLVMSWAIVPFGSASAKDAYPAELQTIIDLDDESDAPNVSEDAAAGKGQLRLQLIKETASSYAQQSAVSWRYGQINGMLEKMRAQLDVTFNFDPLLIDGVMLPPVITRGEDAQRSFGPETLRVVRKIYRIEYPARIVTATPSWRSFLVRRVPKPPELARQVLPKTGAEKQVWKAAAIDGWKAGVEQANVQFITYLNLMVRVLDGMLIYHHLMDEGVVSRPAVATADRGIVFSPSGKELNIGDVIYRIAAPGQFQDASNWRVIPRTDAVGPTPRKN